MARGRPPNPPEFRAEAVRLLRTSGLSLHEISAELGVSIESLRSWKKQAEPTCRLTCPFGVRFASRVTGATDRER